LKSKFIKKIHKASKNENQPPPENRTRIDSNERDTDAVKCVADVSAVKQKPHLFQLLIGKI
jgi:hypothetical protein